MKLESIKLKNFKAFKEAEIRDIPRMCVFVGANGTGKSTIFSVFEFLKIALTDDIHSALVFLGGSKGFDEARSRNTDGPIEIELKFREADNKPLVTYYLAINQRDGSPFVEKEVLRYRRGSKGKPWHFLDFANGQGFAVTNEPDQVAREEDLTREEQTLKSAETLAVKGLAQFKKFPAAMSLGELISNWHISDFHIQKARPEQEAGVAEHLSKQGENLALVTEYIFKRHRATFDKIMHKLSERVPGVSNVEAKTTEEGRVLLRFRDGAFTDPFLAKHVSDGTIKMLAYLILLNDPKPYSLLCVEEPENQLYPTLLEELAEEFRIYASHGGQVFVSTHSPDFLNACNVDEVFWLEKFNGYTRVHRASDDLNIVAYMEDGDKMGYLWKQGFFGNADPS